jgi:uncharacterized protein
MMIRYFLLLALTACMGLTALPCAAQAKHKLVIQVSDAEPAKWSLALNNAKNVQEDLGAANVEIDIVAYGPGIGMLKFDSVAASRLSEAAKAGIKLVACENIMRNQKIPREDMHASSSYVSAGVVHIMQRQREGWAYVRP